MKDFWDGAWRTRKPNLSVPQRCRIPCPLVLTNKGLTPFRSSFSGVDSPTQAASADGVTTPSGVGTNRFPNSRWVHAARRLVSDELNPSRWSSGLIQTQRVRFFTFKRPEKLAGKGYTSTIFEREEIEIESEPGSRGQSRFLSVPPEIASAYWLWQAHRGKKAALALCVGLITESLKRWLDEAFGVTLREGGRNELRASSIARDDRSGGTVRRTNSTDSPADRIEGELESRRSSKSFGPVSRCFWVSCYAAKSDKIAWPLFLTFLSHLITISPSFNNLCSNYDNSSTDLNSRCAIYSFAECQTNSI